MEYATIKHPPTQYAVIGRSENYPALYHMNQTPANAERLRERRETATGHPCYVIAMSEWEANPLTALRAAEKERGASADPDIYPTSQRQRQGSPRRFLP